MKKFVRIAVLLVSLLSLFCLAACETEEMGTLKDISRPYAGVYECEKISLGGKDMTEKFQKFSIELKQDGSFEATYRTAGREGGYGGTYAVDSEKGEITFSAKERGDGKSFTFPYEKGKIVIDYNLFGHLLYAEFTLT